MVHKQLESHRFTVFVGHRRLGKTVMEINHLIKQAGLNRLKAPRYAYIAPFLKQAKLIAWDFIKYYCGAIPGTKVNESDLVAELPNGARIRLFGADNADAMRGTYNDGVVLDEYAQIKPGVYDQIIRPTLTDRKGWASFIGTPKGQNQFLEVYQYALRAMAEGNKDWWAGCYRADETKVIPQEELALLKASLSDRTFRQEFLCDFSAEADNVLITIDLATSSYGKVLPSDAILHAPRVIGVDPARYGDDRSVIFRRQGLQAFTPKILSKVDNMTLAGAVAAQIADFKPDSVFIDAGRGEGVIDRLRQLGHKVMEVNFGGTPLSDGVYSNKRSEMWDLMKQWLAAGGAIPGDLPELKSELVTPTYDYDAAGKMRLESKEKIRERLGKSPDIADALAVTFAYPVRVKSEAERAGAIPTQKKQAWHPWDQTDQQDQDRRIPL